MCFDVLIFTEEVFQIHAIAMEGESKGYIFM